jgi:hypothetical protein
VEVQIGRKKSPLGWWRSTVNGPQLETTEAMPLWLNLVLKLGNLLANQFFQCLQFPVDYWANFIYEIDFLGIDHSILDRPVLHGLVGHVLPAHVQISDDSINLGRDFRLPNSTNYSNGIDGKGYLGWDCRDTTSAPKISDQLRKQSL